MQTGERVGYCCLSSFLYFSIAGQGDQRHILHPDADIFIPCFHATGTIQTDDFGKTDFGYYKLFNFYCALRKLIIYENQLEYSMEYNYACILAL